VNSIYFVYFNSGHQQPVFLVFSSASSTSNSLSSPLHLPPATAPPLLPPLHQQQLLPFFHPEGLLLSYTSSSFSPSSTRSTSSPSSTSSRSFVKKATNVVAEEDDSPEDDRYLDALRRLRAIRINTKVLVSMQVSNDLDLTVFRLIQYLSVCSRHVVCCRA
jgi:hypothetical protein